MLKTIFAALLAYTYIQAYLAAPSSMEDWKTFSPGLYQDSSRDFAQYRDIDSVSRGPGRNYQSGYGQSDLQSYGSSSYGNSDSSRRYSSSNYNPSRKSYSSSSNNYFNNAGSYSSSSKNGDSNYKSSRPSYSSRSDNFFNSLGSSRPSYSSGSDNFYNSFGLPRPVSESSPSRPQTGSSSRSRTESENQPQSQPPSQPQNAPVMNEIVPFGPQVLDDGGFGANFGIATSQDFFESLGFFASGSDQFGFSGSVPASQPVSQSTPVFQSPSMLYPTYGIGLGLF